MAKVAVENSLGNVKQVLQQNGFEVVSIENASGADCCVISGQDDNVMGISDVATNASVINAEGMTADQVLEEVNQRAGLTQ
jgi:predicted transcriptional regulator